MYNKRELKKTERSSAKSNPWAKDRVVTPGAPKVDPNGYWDPANIGRIIEVPSPIITMKGVDQPLVGVGSDTGMVQYMTSGNKYIFPNDSSVVEYPEEQYMELTNDEIAEYRAGGYVVEELPIAQKGTTIKKPVKPVSSGKKYPGTKVDFDTYGQLIVIPPKENKTKVIPTIIGIPPDQNTDPTKMYMGRKEELGYDENGNPTSTIEYLYDDVKLPIKKLDTPSNNTNLERVPQTFPVVDPQKTNTAFRYRDQWQHVYKPVEGDFETFGTKQATMPYGEKRGDNKWEYTKSTDLPESGHHVWMVGDKKYYSEEEAKAAAEQWNKEHSYTFANGGYIADETYYPPKHNPANSFAVNDPRSMGRGGYVDAQMVHFQDGGNMDPGNNALELHMFYDKDVFKKQDGGEIGYYTDQEIEDLRRQGYIVEEE